MKTEAFKKTVINILVLTFVAASLVSCGASKQGAGSSDLSSRLPIDTNIDPDGPIADCSGAKDTSIDLEFQVSSYYMPGTNQVAIDILKMHFSDIPDEIITTDSHYIQLYRWYEDTPGQRVSNPTPVQFYFQRKDTGAIINNEDPQNKLSKAIIQNMIVESGAGSEGITVTNFFDAHILILTGMDLQFDAMSVAIYDHNQGSSAQAWLDVLLPAFYANPNDYITTHSATSLQVLHPNYNYRNGGYTDNDYLTFTDKYCEMFL